MSRCSEFSSQILVTACVMLRIDKVRIRGRLNASLGGQMVNKLGLVTRRARVRSLLAVSSMRTTEESQNNTKCMSSAPWYSAISPTIVINPKSPQILSRRHRVYSARQPCAWSRVRTPVDAHLVSLVWATDIAC